MMFILNPCHAWLLAWSMVLGLPHQPKKQHIVVKCLDPHLHPPFTYQQLLMVAHFNPMQRTPVDGYVRMHLGGGYEHVWSQESSGVSSP